MRVKKVIFWICKEFIYISNKKIDNLIEKWEIKMNRDFMKKILE